MAPYDSFDMNIPIASNWQPSMLRYIYNSGCTPPTGPTRCAFPPIDSPQCSSPCCTTTSFPTPRDTCQQPEITCMPRYTNDHQIDDCCMVPSCDPCPRETPAICVERTRPMKKIETYEPPCQPFDSCSLYRTQFRGCFGPPAPIFKPTSGFDPPRAPMSGLSLYREQFTCKPIGPIERPKKKDDYSPACSPFEGCSTYRIDYKGGCGIPAQSAKPPSSFDFSSGKMADITTYRSEFLPYCPADFQHARGDIVKPNQASHMSCSPFDSCSTYRLDYSPKCSQRTPSMKPPNSYGFPSAKFAGHSTYRNDYLPFCFKECCSDPCLPDPCRRCC